MNAQDQYVRTLDEARTILVTHFTAVAGPEEDAAQAETKADGVIALVKSELGGTTVEALSECSWEDLQGIGVPKLLARQVCNVFRTSEDTADTPDPAPSNTDGFTALADSLRQPGQMNVAELVERYDPNESTGPYAEELRRRFGDKKILVFDADDNFDRVATLDTLRLIEDGLPAEDHYVYTNGTEVDVFPVGRKPGMVFELSPIHLEPMRAGVCPEDRQRWGDVPLRTRQLVHIVSKMGLLANTREASVSIFTLASGENGFDAVAGLYGDAAREFRRLDDEDQLPALKERAGAPKGNGNADPFGVAVGHRNH